MTNQTSDQAILSDGMNTEFWRIITKAIDDEIALLQKDFDNEDLEALPAEQYKNKVEVLRFRKRYLNYLKDFPSNVIKAVGDGEKAEENMDPYKTQADFLPRKQK